MIIEGVSQTILKQYLPNGTIDTSFGNNGIKNYLIGNESNSVRGKIQVADNGSIVLLNKIINSSINSNIIMKCLPDGTLDNGFGINGIATIPIWEENFCKPLLFPDGSILVSCSYFDNSQNIYIKTMLKLSSEEGNLDLNFGIDGFIYDNVADIIQPNQRILIKNLTDWYGDITLDLRRFYSIGSIDSSFDYSPNYDLLLNYHVNLQNNGNILIAGSSTLESTITADIVLQQYNNDPLGIEDQQLEKFSVYPNPSSGIFKIQHDFLDAETPYQVTDALGKIITTGFLKNDQAEINLTSVKSGVYFLSASNKTIKLIKN
jgi:hypothetical protein